ncbi:MAG TPA: ATP-binding protein [Chthoniobacter sp.]|nr:ATP-binding protein [Chthoniobacter sp.]
MNSPTDYPATASAAILPPEREEDLKVLGSALSHDVEGSVRGVKSLANILLTRHAALMDEDGRAMLRLLGSEAERASRLLDGVMDWLTFAQQPLLFAWQDTARIVREAFASASKGSQDRQIEFELPSLPAVWSDEVTLRKALHEVLANAVKFTGRQTVARIAITAEECEREIVLSVRDNGAGFELEHSKQLFKLFRRMHRKQEFPGEGAGLAIVREIMQRHDGRVWADAQLDQGATFHLAFPKPSEDEATH